jgi:O-antigen ligase
VNRVGRIFSARPASHPGLIIVALCMLYLCLVPLESLLLIREGLTFERVLGVAVALILALRLARVGVLVRRKLVVSLILLLVLFGVSIYWSVDPAASLASFPLLAQSFIMSTLMVGTNWKTGQVRALLIAVLIGGVIASALIVAGFREGTFYEDYQNRSSVALGEQAEDPNEAAASLLTPFFVGAFFALRSQSTRRIRVFGALSMLVITGAVFFTGSRGAVLALGTGSLFLLVTVLRSRVSFGKALVLGTALIILVVLLFRAFPLTSQRFSLSFTERDRGANRWAIWLISLDQIDERPLTGHGAATFPSVYRGALAQGTSFGDVPAEAVSHNVFLRVAVELGLLGLTYWLLFQRKLFQYIWRGSSGVKFVWLSSMLAITVASLFLDSITARYYWAGLVVVVIGASGAQRQSALS